MVVDSFIFKNYQITLSSRFISIPNSSLGQPKTGDFFFYCVALKMFTVNHHIPKFLLGLQKIHDEHLRTPLSVKQNSFVGCNHTRMTYGVVEGNKK